MKRLINKKNWKNINIMINCDDLREEKNKVQNLIVARSGCGATSFEDLISH